MTIKELLGQLLGSDKVITTESGQKVVAVEDVNATFETYDPGNTTKETTEEPDAPVMTEGSNNVVESVIEYASKDDLATLQAELTKALDQIYAIQAIVSAVDELSTTEGGTGKEIW